MTDTQVVIIINEIDFAIRDVQSEKDVMEFNGLLTPDRRKWLEGKSLGLRMAREIIQNERFNR